MEKENSTRSYYKDKDLSVGINVHKKRWVVTVRSYDLELKTFNMSPVAEELEKFLLNTYNGALFHIL